MSVGLFHGDEPGSKMVAIIDVSNVTRVGKWGRLNRFIMVMDEMKKIEIEIISIADASLRHHIDDKKTYQKMLVDGTIIQAPARSDADTCILGIAEQIAKNKKLVVVSNDLKLRNSKLFAYNIIHTFYKLVDDIEHVFIESQASGFTESAKVKER